MSLYYILFESKISKKVFFVLRVIIGGSFILRGKDFFLVIYNFLSDFYLNLYFLRKFGKSVFLRELGLFKIRVCVIF